MVGRYSVVYNFFDHFVSLGRLTQFLIGFSFKETVSCIFCLAVIVVQRQLKGLIRQKKIKTEDVEYKKM